MSEQEPEALSPPTEQGDMPEQESTWPKTIGIISLIYAIGGLLCQVAAGFMPMVMGLIMSGVEAPQLIKITGGATAVVVFAIGICMLVGSIRLLQRKRSGTSLLKTWVVLRLSMIIVGLVVAILTAPAQIVFQRSIIEFQNEQLRKSGQESKIVKIDDAKLQTKVMRGTVIGAGIFSVYPLFLGFYLSRKKINEEVLAW